MKARQFFRAKRFAKHLTRFVDRRWHPDFVLTDEIVKAEWKRQTYGETKLTEHEKEIIKPLADAQRWKEVTINGLVEEMAEWWSMGWGWAYPIIDEVTRLRGDWVMKRALLQIKKRCHQDSLGFFMEHGGCERAIARFAR